MMHAYKYRMFRSFFIWYAISSCSVALAEDQQLIELRVYKLRSAAKAELFDRTVEKAVLPALRRQGVGPLGVFKTVSTAESDKAEEEDGVLRYVLIPYNSCEEFVELYDQLAGDEKFRAGVTEYSSAEKSDPVYTRIESSLLKAFTGMPRLEVPERSGSDPRLFELRIYESHSERKGKLKVEMFNEGEIEIFKEVGLNAIFFGEALVAKNLPNLTYMLVHEDQQAMDAAWQRFLRHPDWERMKAMPKYKDTVSKIIKQMLVPLDYSQIQ